MEAAEIVGLGKDRIILLEGSAEGTRNLEDLIGEGKRLEEVPIWKIPNQRHLRVCVIVSIVKLSANRVVVSGTLHQAVDGTD